MLTLKCIACKKSDATRMARRRWMRSIPFSRHHHCEACGTEFMSIAGWFPFRRGFAAVTLFVVGFILFAFLALGPSRLALILDDLLAFLERMGIEY